jgi:chromosome segregation ATPase
VENLRQNNQTEIPEIKSPINQTKNTGRGHSSRLEQVEDRISEFKDKIEIKEKNRKILNQKTSRAVKGIRKNSETPKKRISKKEKRFKPKGYVSRLQTYISQETKKVTPHY